MLILFLIEKVIKVKMKYCMEQMKTDKQRESPRQQSPYEPSKPRVVNNSIEKSKVSDYVWGFYDWKQLKVKTDSFLVLFTAKGD